MFSIAGDLFRGPGAIIIQLALLAIGGWMLGYITQAVGKGQISQLIHMGMIFVAFILVVKTLYDALTAVSRVLGL
jgi:hypothetical protein